MDPRGKPSPATVIASIALFVALANTAAGQLGGDGGGKARYSALKGPSGQIPAKSIGAKQLKPNAVTESKIKEGAVTAPAIGPAAVIGAKIQQGAVDGSKIPAGAVTGTQIADGAVDGKQIATAAVGGGKIASGAVKEQELADDAVSSQKLQALAVLAGKLADNAVATSKIANDAIATEKIKSDAVTGGKLASGSVGTGKIQPNAITQPLLGSQAVGTTQLASTIPAASVTNTTPICVPTGGGVQANTYTAELFDSANMFPGNGGANYRLTAPVNGIYQVTATQMWAGDSSGGRRYMEFDRRDADNTGVAIVGSNIVVPPAPASEFQQTLSGIYKLTAGQSIEVWTSANALAGSLSSCGATSTSYGNSGQRASTFTMSYLNPGP